MDNFLIMTKKNLIIHLDFTFKTLKTLDDLSTISERVEQETQKYCIFIILNETRKFFENFTGDIKFNNYLIDDSGKRYFPRVIADFQDFQELLFLIYAEGQDIQKNSYRYSTQIAGSGRYNKIVVQISKNLKLKNDTLPKTLKMIYETAYEWYGIKIENFVSEKTVSVANNVYNYMRKILCNDSLYKVFWLAVIGKGYGFRLVNEEQVRTLFKTFTLNQEFPYSVNDYVGNLLSTRLPYDELLMKEALDNNEKINADISGAKYTKKGNIYSKTMYALYNGNAFSIYPLFRGEIGIVALFPVEYKNEIELHLDSMQTDIVEEIKKELSNIELAYLLFDDEYKKHLRCGIELSSSNKEVIIMNEMERITNILDVYYKVSCQFDENFVFDSNKTYSNEEIQYREILVNNGMLRKVNGGYCITSKGLQFKENGGFERNKLIDNSGNSGIIIMGNGENIGNAKHYETSSSKDYFEVIKSIRNVIKDDENKDYVESLLQLLEKELNHKEPKVNMVKTILSNLASISTISNFVVKLSEMMPF